MSVIYFESIDEMPLFNWLRCQDGKMDYLVKSQSSVFRLFSFRKKDNPSVVADAWRKLQEDYVEKLGLPDLMVRVARLKERHIKAIKKYLELPQDAPNKVFCINAINEIQVELDRILKEETDTDKNGVQKILLGLSKLEGQRINAKNITVLEFELLIRSHGKAKD